MKEVKEHYTIIDRRLEDGPKEVCRVCGAEEVHSKEYNKPTMKCIEYLREELKRFEKDARIDENGWWIKRYNNKGGIQDDLESIHFHEHRIKELSK